MSAPTSPASATSTGTCPTPGANRSSWCAGRARRSPSASALWSRSSTPGFDAPGRPRRRGQRPACSVPMMGDPVDRHAFTVAQAEVRTGLSLAYIRAGAGGYPLLLVHGWPETRRIWWRNIGPLAEAGFEVIVPDLRGFGDSGLAPDGFYDLAAHARDIQALVCDVLGHERCAAAGGAVGRGGCPD